MYKRPKYGNRKTVVDGKIFDSKKEAYRYKELKLLLNDGIICDLDLQHTFTLVPKQKGERCVKYKADFIYTLPSGEHVIEDVKGVRTKDYIIKRKLVKLLYPEYSFREI